MNVPFEDWALSIADWIRHTKYTKCHKMIWITKRCQQKQRELKSCQLSRSWRDKSVSKCLVCQTRKCLVTNRGNKFLALFFSFKVFQIIRTIHKWHHHFWVVYSPPLHVFIAIKMILRQINVCCVPDLYQTSFDGRTFQFRYSYYIQVDLWNLSHWRVL